MSTLTDVLLKFGFQQADEFWVRTASDKTAAVGIGNWSSGGFIMPDGSVEYSKDVYDEHYLMAERLGLATERTSVFADKTAIVRQALNKGAIRFNTWASWRIGGKVVRSTNFQVGVLTSDAKARMRDYILEHPTEGVIIEWRGGDEEFASIDDCVEWLESSSKTAAVDFMSVPMEYMGANDLYIPEGIDIKKAPSEKLGAYTLKKADRLFAVYDGAKLIGVIFPGRFAVDPAYQNKGIGTELMRRYRKAYPNYKPMTMVPTTQHIWDKTSGKRDEATTSMAVGTTDPNFPMPVLIRWERGMRWRQVLKAVKSVVGEIAGRRVPWREIHIWASFWDSQQAQQEGWEQEKGKGRVMYDILHNGTFVSVGKPTAAVVGVTADSHKVTPLDDTYYNNPESGEETNAYANIPERVRGDEAMPSLKTLAPQMFAKGGAARTLKARLMALRPLIAQAAQEIYDAWDSGGYRTSEGGDVEFGEGGICDSIAREIGGIIAGKIRNVEVSDGGQDGDDHAWTIAYHGKEAYGIDIPHTLYERGGGYSWTKVPGVTFSADDVEIFPVDAEKITSSGTTDDGGKFREKLTERGVLARKNAAARDLSALVGYLTMSPRENGEELARFLGNTFQEYLEEHDLLEQYAKLFVEDGYIEDYSTIPDKVLTDFLEEKAHLAQEWDPANAPTFLTVRYQGMVKNGWLVHFTDHPDAIAKEGFRYGMDRIDTLALTTYFKDDAKKFGGYNFALEAGKRNLEGLGKTYGKHCVLFRADGVKTYHYGDEFEQIIFWGKDAKDIIPIYSNHGIWQVGEDADGNPLFDSHDLKEVIDWAIANKAKLVRPKARARKSSLLQKRAVYGEAQNQVQHSDHATDSEAVGMTKTLKSEPFAEELGTLHESLGKGQPEPNPVLEGGRGEGQPLAKGEDQMQQPKMNRASLRGQAYLLHFADADHYLGWAEDAQERIQRHYEGSGLKIAQDLGRRGTFTVARVWDDAGEKFANKLQSQGKLARWCPICHSLGGKKAGTQFPPFEQWMRQHPEFTPDDDLEKRYGMTRDQMEERYWENTQWLSSLDLPLKIYRALEVEKGLEINLNGTGVHWTWVENSADAYFGGSSVWARTPKPKNPEIVILKAVVSNPSDINFEKTLSNNMQNPDENEITLKPGARIKLLGIDRGEGYKVPKGGQHTITAAATGGAEAAIAEINERFPANPTSERGRVFMARGKPAAYFEVAGTPDGALRLKSISSAEPGSGVGTVLLKRILSIADKHGVEVELTASPFGPEATRLDKDALQAWHRKHKFEDEPGYDPSLGYMVRQPKSAAGAVNIDWKNDMFEHFKLVPEFSWHEYGDRTDENEAIGEANWNMLIVSAFDTTNTQKKGQPGKWVGSAEFVLRHGQLESSNTEVDKNYWRQGIATAMYQYAEGFTGLKTVPHKTQSPAGHGLWQQKDRPFGGN